jgi:hypothetical protein
MKKEAKRCTHITDVFKRRDCEEEKYNVSEGAQRPVKQEKVASALSEQARSAVRKLKGEVVLSVLVLCEKLTGALGVRSHSAVRNKKDRNYSASKFVRVGAHSARPLRLLPCCRASLRGRACHSCRTGPSPRQCWRRIPGPSPSSGPEREDSSVRRTQHVTDSFPLASSKRKSSGKNKEMIKFNRAKMVLDIYSKM